MEKSLNLPFTAAIFMKHVGFGKLKFIVSMKQGACLSHQFLAENSSKSQNVKNLNNEVCDTNSAT